MSIGLAITLIVSGCFSAQAADEVSKALLSVVNYETGWIHDANGYHPAVFMIVENTSGRDLSGKSIKLQARFTDLQTAEVSLGRKEIRRELKSHQQISLSLEGALAYELPFELHLWPSIEAKVMARMGNASDDGVETLVIGKVQAATRTEEEAFQALNQATSYHQRPVSAHQTPEPNPPTRHKKPESLAQPRHVEHERPLVATARKIMPMTPHSTSVHPQTGALSLLSSKSLPGLGDDFYNFEQQFGMPISVDAKRSDWTWAKYRHVASNTEIITGSRERTGKVDVILLKVPKAQPSDQIALVAAGRALAGKLRSTVNPTPTKSVRYLPSGRLELVTASTSSYKIVCMSSSSDDAEDSTFLVASRLQQQDLEQLLTSWSQKSPLLKSLKFLDPKETASH